MFTPKWKFDFKLTIDRHIVAVAPGKQISIHVNVEKIRGNPRPVKLDVNTRWESVGLSTQILPPVLDTSQLWQATMMIRASVSTPPGSYLFTVRGGTEGTFNTSEDAVTVIVDPKAEQRSDEEDNIQPEQPEKITEPSPSLDNLFAPSPGASTSARGAWGKLSPDESEKIKKHGNVGSVIGVIIGIIILIIVFGSTGIFKELFKDGNGGTCPASAPIDCGGGCCPSGDGGRTDVCCPGNKCTSNGKCGSGTIVNPGGCPPLDCGERGLGGAVPKQCPCPPGCPYESVTSPGYKQCSSFR